MNKLIRSNVFSKFKCLIWLGLLFFPLCTCALSERHLIIICHGDKAGLIEQAKVGNNEDEKNINHAKQISNLLLTYGFDNRSIAAVFVSPDKNTRDVAQKIAEIGLFAKNKIHIDKRLADKEGKTKTALPFNISIKNKITLSNKEVRKKVLAVYDEVEDQYQTGHVLFITPGLPAMELIDGLIHSKVQLRTAQAYMLPLVKRDVS